MVTTGAIRLDVKKTFFCAMFFVVVVLKRFLVAITANIQHVF